MMGDNADCDRCGCVVPFHMATISSRRLMIKESVKRLGQRQRQEQVTGAGVSREH